ncbi:diguanylate cyclase [Pseudoxanthomonas sangjuensis]|uniref:sensor domain-containing diguanylate cyclase n=1 Tax=Pseudoxanthomonas sangjuensis TaxID=1503750 RepID=UPI001391C025|nr:diguanylate cyclase [Pseudoxanthomonas sangjuensis]KAF1707393.1 diguanylate cyclase [Pseudoxanthomonas sangjuensis]
MEEDHNAAGQQRSGKRGLNVRLRMRLLGSVLAALCVGAALHADHAAPAWGIALLAQMLFWPPLAWLLARRSRDPVRVELRNLLIDAATAGVWIAAIGFDALPSAMLVALMAMDRTLAGGPAFGLKALASMALACAAASAALGFRFDPVTSWDVVLACLPMLLVYPLATGLLSRGMAEKLFEQKRQLERNSRFDIATGLMNRQQLLFAATGAMERFHRTGRPSVLVMIDIDRFKQINDRFGHTIGDAVVEQFAHLMRACLRDVDTGGRYGGDEFGIVMPDLQWPEAIEAAERLRRQVAACQLFPEQLQCTISMGLAETHPLIRSVTDWVQLADSALYAAKRRGRDCISIARPPAFVARASAEPVAPAP